MHTSFEDESILRAVNIDATPLVDVRGEELKAAYKMIERLEADLLECREFIKPFVDVVDGDYGPAPNNAMRLVSMIDESLHGPGKF